MTLESFTVEAILAAAQVQSGLSDYGGDEFIEPLERLLCSLKNEAQLNATGIASLTSLYINLVVNRLRFAEDLKQHPEILDQELPPPIVVLGLPRSGTTKLQRVLGSHPGLQPLIHWRIMNPAPFPGAAGMARDPRIAYAEAMISAMEENFPDVLAGHPMSAMEQEEETTYLMEMTFDGPLVPVRARTPSYAAWRWQRSMLPSYRYLYKLLQYIRWQQEGDGAVRPYLLKSPLHLGHIAEFATVFQGATIVHCHRDPIESVPSFARLVETGWAMMSDINDRAEFGRASVELLKSHMDRYLEQRPALEESMTFIDVPFRDIVENSIGVAEKILQSHDQALKMDEAAVASIRQWEEANPPGKFGKHEYSLQRYGLTEDGIRKQFAAYYQRFL